MPLIQRVRMLLLALCVCAVAAIPASDAEAVPNTGFWSCVPFARQASAVNLSGDAWRWWSAAAGVYGRGQTPREGSVLVFKRTSTLRQGHVAVVRKVINSRRILIDHANWDRGRRKGRVDQSVGVMDVSRNNDWSEVRVWYTPVGAFGTSHYPTNGFIYPTSASHPAPAVPASSAAVVNASMTTPVMNTVSTAEASRSWVRKNGVSVAAAPTRKPSMIPVSLPKPAVISRTAR